MALKQIFREGHRLGFLPWGTPGRRLGAARWTDLFPENQEAPLARITLATTGVHQLPEIPTLFRHNTTYILPESTIGAHFTIPQRIKWQIIENSSESHLLDSQLSVIGGENSNFVLSAEVCGRVIETYECQIEERERVSIPRITVRVRPIPGREQEGMCEFDCIQRHSFPDRYEDDSQNMELRIGNHAHHPTSHDIIRSRVYNLSFVSSFTLHLSKLLKDGIASGVAYWYNRIQVFTADVIFDYSDLQLEAISSGGCFTPSEVLITDRYSGDNSEEIVSLDLCFGQTTLHGWPVSYTIATPTQSVKIKKIENEIRIPVKRKKIQQWFDSPSENLRHRSIILTPNIAGLDLPSSASTTQLHLEVPEAPCLGYLGDRAEDWIKFLLRPQEEYHIIQQKHRIVDPLSDQSWIDEISPEKLSSMNRNNIYRGICGPTVDPPVTNCERVTELLPLAFNCLEDKVKVDFKTGEKLATMYGGRKVIDVDSTEIQALYPRQKFRLEANDSPISGESPCNSISINQQGESLAILSSNGTEYKYSENGNTGFDFDRLPEAFAYRINSYTFAAPQIPGVYYLYTPSEGGDHYLVEIEVRGFIEEAIE
ncbi:MAG: hypothetical protein GWO84_05465 [Euryarchaeota archaeon]|nr:hypothetical protein [Euryarchaeota archaeon]